MQITQNGTLGWGQSYTITDDKGEQYIYVPEEFANKGLLVQGYQFYNPGFLKKDAFEKAESITLPSNLSIANDAYKNPNKGFVWKAEDYQKVNPLGFDNIGYGVSDKFPAIEGLSTFNGNMVYKVPAESGWQASYITGLNAKGDNTNFRSTRMEGGSSFLGNVLGDWFDDFTTTTGIADIAGGVNDFFQTDLGKAIKYASLASSLSNLATEGAGSEVGGVTGPDNIDVGGGFNPAGAAPITVDTITQQISTPASEQIAAEQAAAQASAQQFAAEQAAAEEASRIAAENAAYDEAMQALAKDYVSPQFATSAAAQGLTFKQALDATRAGLLINAVTGDPLGLSDVGGSAGNNFAESGFAQVPIPEDWKSPTYTYSPVQNVTFEDLFPSVSLQGTQWQNMPQAQTFNEMFASGQQTPMGSPVDINQIVGSILGQSATS